VQYGKPEAFRKEQRQSRGRKEPHGFVAPEITIVAPETTSSGEAELRFVGGLKSV